MRFASCFSILLVSDSGVEGTSAAKSRWLPFFSGSKNTQVEVLQNSAAVISPKQTHWSCEKSKPEDGNRFVKFTDKNQIRGKDRTVTFNGDVSCEIEDKELDSLFDMGEEPDTEEIGCHAEHAQAIPVEKASARVSSIRSREFDSQATKAVRGKSDPKEQVEVKKNQKREDLTDGAIVTIYSPEGWSDAKREKVCEEAKKIHLEKNLWTCKVVLNPEFSKVTYSNKDLGSVVFFDMKKCVNLPKSVQLDSLFSTRIVQAPYKSSEGKKPPCENDEDVPHGSLHCDSDRGKVMTFTSEIRPRDGVHYATGLLSGKDRCKTVTDIHTTLRKLVEANVGAHLGSIDEVDDDEDGEEDQGK